MRPLRKIALISAMLLLSSQSYGLSAVTKDNYVACKSIAWLNDMTAFRQRNDMASFQAYLSARKCIVLVKGRRVAISEAPGIYGSKTGFVLNGIKYWALREALDYD